MREWGGGVRKTSDAGGMVMGRGEGEESGERRRRKEA